MSKLSLRAGAVTSPNYSTRMSRKVRMNANAYSGSTGGRYMTAGMSTYTRSKDGTTRDLRRWGIHQENPMFTFRTFSCFFLLFCKKAK